MTSFYRGSLYRGSTVLHTLYLQTLYRPITSKTKSNRGFTYVFSRASSALCRNLPRTIAQNATVSRDWYSLRLISQLCTFVRSEV